MEIVANQYCKSYDFECAGSPSVCDDPSISKARPQVVPGSVHNKDKRTTRSAIDEDDWQIRQPIIEKLYINEDIQLKEVIEIMEKRFNFRAS